MARGIAEIDADELAEWFECLDDVVFRHGPASAEQLLDALSQRASTRGVNNDFAFTTPYTNTIPVEDQPPYPGDGAIERRIRSLVRWNAMAMVVRANRDHHGIGGHISTFASPATLFEVGFNHFSHARTDDHPGDFV